MSSALAALYSQHLATVRERTDKALALGGFDHLVVAAGRPIVRFLDDNYYPFAVSPHFKHWLPLIDAPGSWIAYTPGKKPKLVFLQPHDYWHVVPEAPSGYWVEHFDIVVIREPAEAAGHLPDATRSAIIADDNVRLDGFAPSATATVMDYLHYHRAFKTPYEQALMRIASERGARGHRAAEAAFRAGKSELGIHMDYLGAVGQIDAELPYASIVGLNQHGSVLHYTNFDREPPEPSLSFLIDAGASASGYASDITRTYASPEAPEFQALIDSVEAAQQSFCAQVKAGLDYAKLHVHAHHVLADILREHGFIRMSAESAVATGVSAVFFPHGLGHGIGMQVHEVAGFQESEHGGFIKRPDGHPYLRLTRTLAPGMVVTIEPGLYFIDMLLAELKEKPEAKHIDWARVDAFRKYGGIRIEDDVVCTAGEPENLTRDAFGQVAAGSE
jgi:Xaa-Pro dipeptidase